MKTSKYVIPGILIAPCGMNCAICLGYQRDKNKCNGCRLPSEYKSNSCVKCIISNCEKLKKLDSGFCYDCPTYPCARLKQLDKRYRTKYNMSMLENLNNIKSLGLKKFTQNESARWRCEKCGGLICVHRKVCLKCK